MMERIGEGNIEDKYCCSKSWSGQHSFEKQEWFFDGESPTCRYCGLVLDIISVKKFNRQKLMIHNWRRKFITNYIESLNKKTK